MVRFFILLLCLISGFYCQEVEFTGPAYQSLKASEKSTMLMQKLRENQTPYGWYSKLSFLGIFFTSMPTSFEYESDKLPEGRKKLIHSVGSVGKVEFISSNEHNYTGIFKGCKEVILRLSAAVKYHEEKPTAEGADHGNFIPGFGIKFLRDGVPSANMVAMYGVDGQPSWNYFAFSFSNHVPDPIAFKLKVASYKFATAQKEVGAIGAKPLSEYDQLGRKEVDPKFPFRLEFRPTPEVSKMFTHHYTQDLYDQFEQLKVGQVIYDIYGIDKPHTTGVRIGSLKITEPFKRSEWGDKHLYFKHNYAAADYKDHPEWEKWYADEFKNQTKTEEL